MKKLSWLPPVLIAAACAAVAAVWLARITPPSSSPRPPAAAEKPRDFSLTDTSGQTVSLANYRGKWLLMFFGFTHCPDACPTAMLNVGATLKEMGPEAAARIQPIFVSLDPERDTPDVLKDYLANFGDNIVGLSGTPQATTAVAKAYGVFYRKMPLGGDDYTLEHSTALYLVSPEGLYVRAFTPNADPAIFARELNLAMTSKP